MWRAAAVLCFFSSAVAISFALVSAFVLDVSAVGLVIVGAWTATLGLLCVQGPRILNERTTYLITETQVVSVRGPFRRSIARNGISYVRLLWSNKDPGVGDIELVRSVPTGPLKRRHVVRLNGVAAPDKLWELITGEPTANQPNWDGRSIGQRLRAGEKVLWTARSQPSKLPYLPRGNRQWKTLALAMFLFVAALNLLMQASRGLGRMLDAGLLESPGAFALIVTAEGLTLVLLLGAALFLTHDAVIRPARLLRNTRYIITDRRFLIQRDYEELHLDRDKIVDVIDAPALRGFRDLFLVLDGPRARALALSGAFGEVERGVHLRPVLESVEDAESATAILLDPHGSAPGIQHSAH